MHRLADWAYVHLPPYGAAAVREVYSRVQRSGIPSRLPLSFYQHCVDVELTQSSVHLSTVRSLLESAVTSVSTRGGQQGAALHGEDVAQLWASFVRFERKHGDPATASRVYWRASRAVNDPDAFSVLLSAAGQD